jgi:hypothetical protein
MTGKRDCHNLCPGHLISLRCGCAANDELADIDCLSVGARGAVCVGPIRGFRHMRASVDCERRAVTTQILLRAFYMAAGAKWGRSHNPTSGILAAFTMR